MRKITEQAITVFLNAGNMKNGNTRVYTNDSELTTELYLHGNMIAWRDNKTGNIHISNAGWFSNTTKERLNGIPGVRIHQKAGVWYLNNEKWDGGWTDV